jgi:hypothetical protein
MAADKPTGLRKLEVLCAGTDGRDLVSTLGTGTLAVGAPRSAPHAMQDAREIPRDILKTCLLGRRRTGLRESTMTGSRN